MQRHVIELPMKAISAFCRTQPILHLSLFGSILRADSDVDIARVIYEKE